MAPFKLKFRMGSSRSTSQEVDGDPQVNQSLLNNSNIGMGASNSTIDSTDCNSLESLANDKRSLLPNNSNGERLGYMNPVAPHSADSHSVPQSPPPSYEHVLEENRLANFDRNSRLTSGAGGGGGSGELNECSISRIQNCSLSSPAQNLSSNTCTDPDCTVVNGNQHDNNRKESIDSTEYLISNMTTPSSHENLLDCTGSCDPLFATSSNENAGCDEQKHSSGDMDMEHQHQLQHQQQQQQDQQGQHHHHQDSEQCHSSEDEGSYSDGDWDSNQSQMYQQPEITTTEIISNKSSKEIYKAVAKQWGITCKMSEQCRCMECQSNYFDCEFDQNEQNKTDGGLGAGAPMFISEVMHGSACTIL